MTGMPYQNRQVICSANNCTWWQKDYNNMGHTEAGICGGSGSVFITKDGRCANFSDKTKEDTESE